MKKVVICASASLYEKAEVWRNKLKDMGYDVIRSIERINNDQLSYKKTHIKHYKKIKETDVLFILNLDKNGVKNYIGPSVFVEIAFAIGLNVVFEKNIQIYCLKPLPKNLPYSDELFLWQKLKWIKIWDK